MPAISWRAPASASLGALLVAASVAACSSHSQRDHTPSPTPSLPLFSTPAESVTPTPSASPAAPVLPGDCAGLVPLHTVEAAIGAKLGGEVTYLRAAPVPKSGRTGRVTCGYGTPTSTPGKAGTASPSPAPTPDGPPLVEISYITYTDAPTAAGRVALTVRNDGRTATVSQVSVKGLPASVLVGGKWNELVMSDGASTIVVEASPTVLAAGKAPAALTTLAAAVVALAVPATAGPTPTGSAPAASTTSAVSG